MPYQYNPHSHVKIWLSKNKESFLNLENQERLIKMRGLNAKDDLYFVFDRTLLSLASQDKLKAFCKQYRIIPVDLRRGVTIIGTKRYSKQ